MKKPWFHILLALAEGTSHGAEIQRRVAEQEGGVRLYPVMLYKSLDELEGAGWIQETNPPSGAQHREKRRYYRITPDGRKALGAEAEQMEAAVRRVRAVLKPRTAR